jgi:hypothetical protein
MDVCAQRSGLILTDDIAGKGGVDPVADTAELVEDDFRGSYLCSSGGQAGCGIIRRCKGIRQRSGGKGGSEGEGGVRQRAHLSVSFSEEKHAFSERIVRFRRVAALKATGSSRSASRLGPDAGKQKLKKDNVGRACRPHFTP